MAGKAYLTQPRDRVGKWTGAIIGRTRGGVPRAFTNSDERALSIPGRSKESAGKRAKATRAKIKSVDQLRSRALAGERLLHPESGIVTYQSPTKIAEAKRLRGHDVKPRGEAMAGARGRRSPGLAQRAVAFNPLSGRFTDSGVSRTGQVVGDGSRPVTRASAARAKLAPAPRAMFGEAEAARRLAKKATKKAKPKPGYVGRRRAEP